MMNSKVNFNIIFFIFFHYNFITFLKELTRRSHKIRSGSGIIIQLHSNLRSQLCTATMYHFPSRFLPSKGKFNYNSRQSATSLVNKTYQRSGDIAVTVRIAVDIVFKLLSPGYKYSYYIVRLGALFLM